jgi:hypothetical protein
MRGASLRLLRRFTLGHPQGSFGTVRLVFNNNDHEYYAMKIVDRNLLSKRRRFGRAPAPDSFVGTGTIKWSLTKKEIEVFGGAAQLPDPPC